MIRNISVGTFKTMLIIVFFRCQAKPTTKCMVLQVRTLCWLVLHLELKTSTGCCMRPKTGQGLTFSDAIMDLVEALSSILVVMTAI